MHNREVNLGRIAEALNQHGVDYVLVGGLAVILQGGDTITRDADLAFDRSSQNLERLADALEELSAKPKRWSTKNYRLRATDLATKWLHLESDAGDLDLIVETPGVAYQTIRANCEQFVVDDKAVSVASIEELLEIKRNAGRPKDLLHVAELEHVLKLRQEPM